MHGQASDQEFTPGPGWHVVSVDRDRLQLRGEKNYPELDIDALLPLFHRYCAPFQPEEVSESDMEEGPCVVCGTSQGERFPCGLIYLCSCTNPMHYHDCARYGDGEVLCCPCCAATLRHDRPAPIEIQITIHGGTVTMRDMVAWTEFRKTFPDMLIQWTVSDAKLPAAFINVISYCTSMSIKRCLIINT